MFAEDGTDKIAGSPRLTVGKTNAAFMDGHAEGVPKLERLREPEILRPRKPRCSTAR